jgi:hypothetical protein
LVQEIQERLSILTISRGHCLDMSNAFKLPEPLWGFGPIVNPLPVLDGYELVSIPVDDQQRHRGNLCQDMLWSKAVGEQHVGKRLLYKGQPVVRQFFSSNGLIRTEAAIGDNHSYTITVFHGARHVEEESPAQTLPV